VSSIKDLLQEEKDAEELLQGAEKSAEAILKEAEAKAAELVRRARRDDALVNELAVRHKDKVAALRAKTFAECQAKAAEAERLYKKNLGAAVKLIVDNVLGVEIER
jgi:vacuolar-type H+-ATPase subunit H